MKPSVSVIIPSHNRAQLLPRALDSVFRQTCEPLEVLVVDDGSTDGTEAMLARQFPAVRCIRQVQGGVSAARNTGIQTARGEWLALLDSDDAWSPTKLERQLAVASPASGQRLVHCDEQWFRHGKPLAQKKYHAKRGGDVFLDSLERCVISPSAALMHRKLIDDYGLFDESLPACEDYDLWLRITAREPVAFVPDALVIKYGGHADQLSRSVPALDRYRVRALLGLLRNVELAVAQREAVLRVLQTRRDIFVAGAQKRGHHAAADEVIAACADALRGRVP